jgi:hypothetical protein
MVSNSIMCWTIYNGITFRSLFVHAKMSLNSFKSSISCDKWSSEIFTFTCYTFSLVPKLILVNYSSSITIQLTMVTCCIHYWASVSSMIISPTFGWKKVIGRCCLTMSGNIAKLIAKTHTNSTCYFRTNFAILKFGMHVDLKINSVWVGIVMVPIE